jgi:hypothetical protein
MDERGLEKIQDPSDEFDCNLKKQLYITLYYSLRFCRLSILLKETNMYIIWFWDNVVTFCCSKG